jgi:hypothetical protein
METVGFSFVFGTVGLVGLALLMGAAFSSLAELATLLAGHGVPDGGEVRWPGRRSPQSGSFAAPWTRALPAAAPGGADGADAVQRVAVDGEVPGGSQRLRDGAADQDPCGRGPRAR